MLIENGFPSFRIQRLYEAIDEYVQSNIETSEDSSMNIPDVDKYCLARFDGYIARGKIFDVAFDESQCTLNVYLVDIGRSINVGCSDVFEIPDNLIEMMPFQVR